MSDRNLPSYFYRLLISVLVMMIAYALIYVFSPSLKGSEPALISTIDSLHGQLGENNEQHLIAKVLARWSELDSEGGIVSHDSSDGPYGDSAEVSFDTLDDLGYEVISSVQSMETLIRLGYPAIVKIFDPITEQEASFSLLKRVGDQFEVALPDGNTHLASSVDVLLSRVISIQIPWKNRESLPLYVSGKSESKNIEKLQHLLALAGGRSLYRAGEYDEETIRMVRDIQRRGGITIDGEVGPQTLLLLYRMTDASVPQLEAVR